METKKSTIGWIAAAIIIGIILGLGGWYLFISRQTSGVEHSMQARGFFDAIPNVGGLIGSTAHNLGNIIGLTSKQNSATTSVVGQGGILSDGTILVTGSGEIVGDGTTATTSLDTSSTPLTPSLWQLSRTASAEIVLTGATNTQVLFVDRGTGYVYKSDVFSGVIERITNTLIPKSLSASFIQNGVLLQHLTDEGTVATFSGTFSTTSTSTLQGNYLEAGIVDVTGRTDMRRILYLAPDKGGVVALIANADGSNARRIWSSTLQGWNASLTSSSTAFVTQHAAAGIEGSAYRINTANGNALLAFRGPGLNVVPAPNGNAMIVSTAQVGSVHTFISTGLYATTTPLTIKTLAEKCVWSPVDGIKVYCAVPSTTPQTYPDTWYRGEAHTTDTWWSINVETGVAKEVFKPSELSVTLDVMNPFMNAAGTHIAFLDARTLTPWVLRISDYEKDN